MEMRCFPTDEDYMAILAYMMSVRWTYCGEPVIHVNQLENMAESVANSLNELIAEDERYKNATVCSGGFEAIYIQDQGIVVRFKGIIAVDGNGEEEVEVD